MVDESTNDKKEDLSIDIGAVTQRTVSFFKKHYLLFVVLIPIILSIAIRIQPMYLPVMDAAAENNLRSYLQSSLEQQIAYQYPNLPAENRAALVQQQLDEVYAAGTIPYGTEQISLEALIKQNANELKAQFQDEYGLTYLGEIDPWYFYRNAENYIEHGYEADIEIDGKYYDTHQLAGTPLEKRGGSTSKLPHFHVMIEVYLYKTISLFMPNARLMTVVYFLPVLLGALSIIPAFFLVKKVAGTVGGLVASILVAVHPSFVGRTVAGFSDTDGYNVLFPLLIMWLFAEALEERNWKKALGFAAGAGFFVGVFGYTWGGWWYIYDFLLGVSFIILWYTFLKQEVATKTKKEKIYWIVGSILLAPLFVLWKIGQIIIQLVQKKWEWTEQTQTVSTLLTFFIACLLFVSLFASFTQYVNALKEPFAFSTIKEVGVIKIWPNVLTTVAEFNPAALTEIIGSASFGQAIILLFSCLGLGYILFERSVLKKEQEFFVAGVLVWVIIFTLFSAKIESTLLFSVLLAIPLGYCWYKKMDLSTWYFAGIAVWYGIMIKLIPLFNESIFLFFLFLGFPLVVGILYAVMEEKKVDVKYGVLLFVWFAGTIYASTQGVRFVMILVPAYAVAVGFGVAFVYKLGVDVFREKTKLRQIYGKILFIALIGILLLVPISDGYTVGKQQMPLINDQWYNALKKINAEAAPDAIVNSWWDFGHWFKAIADRPVTFDGGSQDTPQAHWIGRALLTDNEEEAVGILRMLDCGGNTAYDTIYNYTNNTYEAVMLTKEIILYQGENGQEQAAQRLQEAGFTEEQQQEVLQWTHCTPPEDYFITSQDMVGKSGVWAHFGSWNFERAYVVNTLHAYPTKDAAVAHIAEILSISAEQADALYNDALLNDPNNWIASWPSYVGMPTPCWQEGTTLFCESGLVINLENGETQVQTSDGLKHPLKLVSINPNGMYEVTDFSTYEDVLTATDGSSYSAILIPEGTSFKGSFMNSELAESMFTKLFFFKGHGLSCFDLFDQQFTVTGETIYVWKVDWSCSSANMIYTVQQQSIEQQETEQTA